MSAKRAIYLSPIVVPSLVEQAFHSFVGEAVRGPHDRRPNDIQRFGNRRASVTSSEPRNDVKSQRRRGIRAPTTGSNQLSPHVPAHSRYLVHSRVLPFWGCGNSQTGSGPCVFSSILDSDRASRSVILDGLRAEFSR
ncbi:hypothetical protein LVJ94_17275 [Pendulispora rubella]|uniref:Uncharacterized protein n=1 Tax=Pendulispora rubella TaxID=2741070 RepID=A0ABZ2LDK4_9BACT